jgi:hypothetical protein
LPPARNPSARRCGRRCAASPTAVLGRHQYFNTSDCSLADRGPTAYRVLTNAEGAPFLRVCFSKPETPEPAAEIAPDGSSTDVNDECLDSAVRSLPARAARR